MKSMLLVVVLVLSTVPAWAAEPVALFQLAQPLACATVTSASSGQPSFFAERGPGIPQPLFATGCTAEQQCPPSGSTISCQGNASCSVGEYWVTCDGQTTYCGCVGCDLCWCDCYAGGGRPMQCLQECRFNC